jgi:Fic/DOC family protein
MNETVAGSARSGSRALVEVWTDGREYESLVPAPVAAMEPVGGFAEAEEAVREADAVVSAHPKRHTLVSSLLYAESLPSTLVNRLATGRRVAPGPRAHRAMAAFRRAVAAGAELRSIEQHLLTTLHGMIVPGGGEIRRRQVWVAGKTPPDAIFVPPPAELVPDLLPDLISYLGRRDVSPLEQAAIAYGQLESIHPFLDGNGRMGRCLMQVVARQRGLVRTVAAPLGLLFAAHLPNFIDAHRGFREGDQAVWCRYVAGLAAVSARTVLDNIRHNGRRRAP